MAARRALCLSGICVTMFVGTAFPALPVGAQPLVTLREIDRGAYLVIAGANKSSTTFVINGNGSLTGDDHIAEPMATTNPGSGRGLLHAARSRVAQVNTELRWSMPSRDGRRVYMASTANVIATSRNPAGVENAHPPASSDPVANGSAYEGGFASKTRLALLILCILLLAWIAVFMLRRIRQSPAVRRAPFPRVNDERPPPRVGAVVVARHRRIAYRDARPTSVGDGQIPGWWVKFQTTDGKVGIRLPDIGSRQERLIGRDRKSADVPLTDPGISHRHARLELTGEQLAVEDLGSTNGTLVNGERLLPGQLRVLRPGDRLGLGSVSGIVGRD